MLAALLVIGLSAEGARAQVPGAPEHAERLQLVARIEHLAGQLAGADLDRASRQRLERDLERSFARLTELNAREGLDVGARIVLRRDPGATGGVRRMLGEAERRAASAARTGYIGITLSPTNNLLRLRPGGEMYVRYLDHPSIITVEPNSPAERAGLRRGDVVLAYNDMDVRGEIPMHEVLEPGRPMRIRVRRDGREHTVQLTVAEPTPLVLGRREEFLLPARVGGARTALPEGEPGMPRMPLRFTMPRGVAGAELTPVTAGLGEALGVKQGLLVLAVAPRSPAQQAGLRDGDVIVKAEGRLVESIPALSRVIRERDAERVVALELRRDRKTRTVRLRW